MTNASTGNTHRKQAQKYLDLMRIPPEWGSKQEQELDQELPNIRKFLDKCFKDEDWDLVIALQSTYFPYLSKKGHWSQCIHFTKTAQQAAKNAEEHRDYYRIVEQLAATYYNQNDIEKSKQYYEDALKQAENDNNHVVVDRIKRNLLAFATRRDSPQRPPTGDNLLEKYQQELARAQKHENPYAEAFYLDLIGRTYLQREEISKALENFKRAYAKALAIDDPVRVSDVLAWVAYTYQKTKRYDESLDFYEWAIDVAIENNLFNMASNWRKERGDTWWCKNEYSEAIEDYRRSLQLNSSNVSVYGELANVLFLSKRFQAAETMYVSQRDLHPTVASNANLCLGAIALFKPDIEQAQRYFNEALRATKNESNGNYESKLDGDSLEIKAVAYWGLGQTKKALDLMRKAMAKVEPEKVITEFYTVLFEAPDLPPGFDDMVSIVETQTGRKIK